MKFYFNRPVLSWALYDFANSAFATTVLSVIFNVYFVKVICAGGVPLFNSVIPGEAFWGYAVSASMLIVLLLTPVLGAIADCSGLKKKFLFFFCALGCLFTALLFFCQEGDYWRAALFFIFANVGFAAGNAFYNALLNVVSTNDTVGRISGFGWATGYLGGGLLLALNLAMIEKPHWFYLSDQNHLPVRASVLSVSMWWILFSIPLFLWVQDRSGTSVRPPIKKLLEIGVKNVLETLTKIREHHRELFKFLLAYLIYNDGIETMIIMASIFGAKELGMSAGELVLCFLMIQGVALFGSLLFGVLADRVSHKRALSITLWVYCMVCGWAALIKTRLEFWVLGGIVGVILGGSQAVSRSLLTLMIPQQNSAQFFGFFALAGKLSTVLGPFLFGFLSQTVSLRFAVGSLTLYFAIGLIILYFVKITPLKKAPVA